MRSEKLAKDKRALHLKAINEVGDGITDDEVIAALQLEFEFEASFNHIAVKDAILNVKAITKACIRLGAIESTVKRMLQTLAINCPDVKVALKAIEKELP